jgi:hypothetical protein
MKTLLWDDHKKPISNIRILKEKSNFLTWFYLFDYKYKVFTLYHNVAI